MARRKIMAKVKSTVVELMKTIVFVLVFYFTFTFLVAEAFYIPSGSMEPTLLDGKPGWEKVTGDRILVAKGVTFKVLGVDRGDIIVFRSKGSKEEPFWRKFILWRANKPEMVVKRVVGLPGDQISIKDRRLHVNGEPVEDPEVFKDLDYTPKGFITSDGTEVPEDHYLVLGDNTDNSRDSRDWGFLPVENTAGVALFRFWPPLRVGPIRYNKDE